MSEIANEAVPATWRETEITATDRCDKGKCGAAAMVRTFHNGKPELTETAITDLLWCSHHFNDLSKETVASFLHVQDTRPVFKKVNDVSK